MAEGFLSERAGWLADCLGIWQADNMTTGKTGIRQTGRWANEQTTGKTDKQLAK